MKITIFGLSVTSSWGNGHAALWRGLIRAFLRLGHQVEFFERDTPYYADNRDLHELSDGGRLVLYPAWHEIAQTARKTLDHTDVAIVTSYCPDALQAAELTRESRVRLRCFYDLDSPVTLARIAAGDAVAYIGPEGLRHYDLVLSYTGGGAPQALQTKLGARRVVPIYGSVDPDVHRPAADVGFSQAAMSYLGTYARDRQTKLQTLFIEPARRLPTERFLLAGAQYPDDFPWQPNIHFLRHLPPAEHRAFYASARLTLNITRADMAAFGWCPSGRLFEAAACCIPIVTDYWPGLNAFFEPASEILIAETTDDAMAALRMAPADLAIIARRARERVLDQHTAFHRAKQMIAAFEGTDRGESQDGEDNVGNRSGRWPSYADAAAGVL